MAKVNVILYKQKTLKNGEHPILIRVSHFDKTLKISTGLSSTPERWNAEYQSFIKDKRINPDHLSDNAILIDAKAKAARIIQEFERQRLPWTLKMFEAEFKQKQFVNLGPAAYFESHIEKLKEAGRFGYAETFASTLRILQIFDAKFNKLQFPDIDTDYIRRFDRFLREKRELKDTSISVYMRTLGTLLKAAITDDLLPAQLYPFGGKGYRVSELNTQTRKRFIPIEFLKKINSTPFDDLRLETARRLFLFTFHCRGLNFADAGLLTWEHLQDGINGKNMPIKLLRYTRQKTGKPYEIVINADIQQQLDYLTSLPTVDNFLLPIVTIPGKAGDQLRRHIRERRTKFNDALKDIAKALEFPEPLKNITSYFARHSFAMALRGKGTGIELISEALGHSDIKTTAVYLDSFGRDAVADQTEHLL